MEDGDSMSARIELTAIARRVILSPPDKGFMTEAIADAILAAGYVKVSEAGIERAAKATYAEGAFCGTCEFEGWDSCADCRRCNMDYARAVVAALREGA